MTEGWGAQSPSLLLLPGTLCDAELWAPQVCSLGHAVRPAIADVTRDDSIAGMADRVLAAAPARFLLAGLSMGAIVAFEIMRRCPERVAGLALLNTNPSVPDTAQIDVWRAEIELAERGDFESLVEERWIPLLLGASGERGPSLRPIMRRMALHVGPDAYARQLRAQIGRRESWSCLPAIACPTLVVGGRQDILCSPELQGEMAEALPNARLAIVEDCGHLSTLEQPEEVTGLLRRWIEWTRQPAHAVSHGTQHA